MSKKTATFYDLHVSKWEAVTILKAVQEYAKGITAALEEAVTAKPETDDEAIACECRSAHYESEDSNVTALLKKLDFLNQYVSAAEIAKNAQREMDRKKNDYEQVVVNPDYETGVPW